MYRIFLLLVLILPFITSCRKESPYSPDRVIIGIPSDIQTLNPLYAYTVDEGAISELLFLSLVTFKWDEEKGNLKTVPMLATDWIWNSDSTSLSFNLREDVYWSDGIQCTAEDVLYSFDLYSDPVVQSKLLGSFKSLYLNDDSSIDLDKSFKILNPFSIQINFRSDAAPVLPEIIFPLIPKHVFSKYERKDIATAKENLEPVTNGAFKLSDWSKNQSVTLRINENSFLYNNSSIKEIIFKVVPDYNSRLTQLKKGEIDLTELVKPDDISELKRYAHLSIKPVKGREYDYVGWNNIDPDIYQREGRFISHKLFGDARVRRALTHAINRKEILEEYLLNYGELAAGPVSPIFKEAIDPNLKPHQYNPSKAKQLLAESGWTETDKDGILQKGKLQFRFTLHIPSGNPRRSYAATVIKNNLRAVGIDVNVITLEPGVLIEEFYSRKIDAWMMGWFVPIPVDLKMSWYSDLEVTPVNFVGYGSAEADQLLDKMEKRISVDEYNQLLKEFQAVINRDEPMTFMYWLDNITVYNNRISNMDISPLGVVHHCWEWTINN